MGRKVLATTLVSALIWGVCYLLITSPWLSFRTGWLAGQPQ
jgi:predicted secreted protein